MRKTITVQDRQSVIDIAVQEYGSAEGCFALMRDNPSIVSITQQLSPGEKLRIISAPEDKAMLDLIRKKKIIPVSLKVSDSLSTGDFNEDYNYDYFT